MVPSSPTGAPTGFTFQSIKSKSPSSEAAQNVVVVYLAWNRTLVNPSSPDPSCLIKDIWIKGFQMYSELFFISSFSTGLVSQMLTIPSSETDKKCTILPSEGFLLSTFTPSGTNWISETKFLCDYTMYEMARLFNFTTTYYAKKSCLPINYLTFIFFLIRHFNRLWLLASCDPRLSTRQIPHNQLTTHASSQKNVRVIRMPFNSANFKRCFQYVT